MKVLTIKQPWATLIMQGDKRFEFRSWQTKYRGDLLIHAGKGIDKEAIKDYQIYSRRFASRKNIRKSNISRLCENVTRI